MSPPDPACAFCQVVAGAAPSHVVFEDAVSVAFLDHRPLFPGHCLLVPRAHVPTLTDAPPEVLGPLFANAQLLARAVEAGLGAEGSFVAVNTRVSQTVIHLHVHVVPRRRHDGLRGFFWPRRRYASDEEAAQVQGLLRAALADLAPRPA